MGWNVDHVEPVGLPAVPQQVDVTLSSGAEPVVVADHDGCTAEAFHQHIAHEVGGLEPGEIPVERLDDQVVEAGAGELRNALVEGLEQLESAVVPKQDLSGVGVEGEDEGLRVLRTGPVDHPVQQGAVAEVDPVKGARGHDALGTSGEMGKTAVNVHCDQR